MPPGQHHRRVPSAILPLLLLLTVLFSNVRQGLGNDFAENAGAPPALKLIDNKDSQPIISRKVRDGRDDIVASQSKETQPNPMERSEKSAGIKNDPGSGAGNNSTQSSGVNIMGTFLGLLGKLIEILVQSKSHNHNHGTKQGSQLPNLSRDESSYNTGTASTPPEGDSGADVPKQATAPKTAGEAAEKQENRGCSGTTPSCDETRSKPAPENQEGGQRGGADAGYVAEPTGKVPEEKQPARNQMIATSVGEPGEASKVESTSEKSSDLKREGALTLRKPRPIGITRRRRTSFSEITVVNFVSWKLNSAAGVGTTAVRRNSIRRKLTIIYANRIKISFSSGTRSFGRDKNGSRPYRSSYQVYRAVISNGRVLKFEEITPTSYRGFRTVGILNVGLAVALYCQKKYSRMIDKALLLQCRIWKRKYRKLFYQYEKLRSFPRYNRGSYKTIGNFYSNKAPYRAEAENAPSDGGAEVGSLRRRGALNSLARSPEMDQGTPQQQPSAVEQRKLPSESGGSQKLTASAR